MKKLTRRATLLGAGGAIGWGFSGFLRADLPTYAGANRIIPPTGEKILNDASGLSATPIHKHQRFSDSDQALVARIRGELKEARGAGRSLNVGAARHSMGAQAIPRDGTAITFENSGVEIDSSSQYYHAHAGTVRINRLAR